MRSLTPRVPIIALAFLVLVALSSSGRFLARVAGRALTAPGRDEVTRYEERFRALRRLLPTHGVVGYVSDRLDAEKEYYLTQYALAPVVLERTPLRPLVVGNFFVPRAGAGVAARARLTMIEDFGQGVVLYRGPVP